MHNERALNLGANSAMRAFMIRSRIAVTVPFQNRGTDAPFWMRRNKGLRVADFCPKHVQALADKRCKRRPALG